MIAKLLQLIVATGVAISSVIFPKPPIPQPTVLPISTPSPSPTLTPPSPSLSPTPTLTPTPAPQSLMWGTYTGWLVSDIVNFESRVGKEVNLITTFVHWGNESEFPIVLANWAKANGKTMVIFWESMNYNVATPNDPTYSYDSILRGDWDTYLTSFAESVSNFNGDVILIPFEEMNGNWYPWSGVTNGNTPQKHIEAFQYLQKFFDRSTVSFAWDVNAISEPNTPENSIESYYPGDEYVDYIGINGFNFGNPWMSFDEIFGDALETLSTKNKPIFIFSMASADGPNKAAWIRNALGEEVYKYPQIKGWSWFNENKERDWRVWSDEASLKAFQEVAP